MRYKPFLSTQEGFTTLHPIPEDLPQHPFFMAIIGPSRSGKSCLARTLLKEVYYKVFDYIFLFSQSLDLNNDFEEFEKIVGYNSFDENEILDILNDQKTIVKQGKRDKSMKDVPGILLIFDDVADNQKFCNSKVLRMLAYRSRHQSVSCLVLSQKSSSIPRGCRLNLSHEIIFKPVSGDEMDFIVREAVPRQRRKQFFEKAEKIFEEPYTFIYFDNLCKSGKNRIKLGFDKVLQFE